MQVFKLVDNVNAINKQIDTLIENKNKLIKEFESEANDKIYYEFNYKEFPGNINIPLEILEKCKFQFTDIESLIDDEHWVEIEAWEIMSGTDSSFLHTFIVTIDEFKKYFKEINK